MASDKAQIASIKSLIETDFEARRQQLDLDKKTFGLSESESFSSAILGDGVPYYVISSGKLAFQGYIFPIKVGNKPAGIAEAVFFQGKWMIVSMTNILTFEQELSDAKTLANAPAKLVYDPRYQLFGLVTENPAGNSIILMRDSLMLNLKKSDIKNFQETIDSINQLGNSNNLQSEWYKAGGIGVSSKNESADTGTKILIIALSVFALSIGVIVFRKRKQSFH